MDNKELLEQLKKCLSICDSLKLRKRINATIRRNKTRK